MAFESVAALASFDITPGQPVPAVSPILYDLIYSDKDRAFLSRVSDGPTVENVKYSWWERTQRPAIVQANEAVDIAETVITLVAGHSGRIVVGAILMDEAAPAERMIVTAISGNDITVIKGYGGTDDAAHADQAKFRIVGLPAQEMSSTGLDLLRHPSELVNYTQIFRRDLKASRSSQGVKTYSGYTLNAKRLQEKMEEIRDELEQTSLFGVSAASTPEGSDTVLRTTGGLFAYVTNIDATTYAAQTPEDIKGLIDVAARELVEAGTDPNFIMAGGAIFGAIQDLDSDKLFLELNDGVRGMRVSAIRTKFGPVLDLVYDRWLPAKWLCVGDYRKVQMRLFSNGGNPHIEQLAKTKDGDEMMVIGELGFQVENGAEAFKLLNDVTPA